MRSCFRSRVFTVGALALSANSVLAGTPESCSNPQLSCHNTTAIDTCCINAPGGYLLQTQFWDYAPSSGPTDSWTIHGLWPDNCDGTYDASCDPSRAYTNITSILNAFGKTDLLSYMQTYWVSNEGSAESFWEHEWGKHGTCVSTLDPTCYTSYQPTQEVPDFFQKTVDVFKTLNTYKFLSDAGITPSSSKTYTLSEIQSALTSAFGGGVVVQCDDNDALDEAWYYYNVQGSLQSGTFKPTAADGGSSSSCPSSGIKYPPKSGGSGGGGGGGGGGSFSGSGYLNVVENGSQNGCLISYGTWYVSGTCAGYTATPSGSGFTLSSSKGKCAVSSGKFTCSSSISSGTVFGSSNGALTYGGSTSFSAAKVPTGSDQETVSAGSGSVNIQITWQST